MSRTKRRPLPSQRLAPNAALVAGTIEGALALPLLALSGQRFAVVRTPGLYAEEAGEARGTFAVNITDPDVSNTAHTAAAASRAPVAVTAGMSPRPWWIYLAALAFAIALVEWWTWLRRITV
jgi:hypothetical protein